MLSTIATFFTKTRTFCHGLAGWHRWFSCFFLGCLTSLAMPPIGLAPVYLVTFPALIWLLESSTRKRDHFLIGFLFAMGFFVSSLYWISLALLIDFAAWWWLLPFPTLLLPGILSFFIGCGTLLSKQIPIRSPSGYTILLIACFSLFDYLRGTLFTGFPWAFTGYTWMQTLPVAQNLSWAGISGLSLLTLCWAAIPAFLVDGQRKTALAFTLSFILCLSWGAHRLYSYGTEYHEDTVIRLVQADIPQDEKWERDKRRDNFLKHVRLSQEPARTKAPITHIIWPETALTFDWEKSPAARQYLRDMIKDNQLLLSGQLRIERPTPGETIVLNSLVVIDHTGTMLGKFDKTHLLPFGEYLPFREWISLSAVGSSISGASDFTQGTGPYTVRIGDHPAFSPLICYEVAFPSEVTDPDDRPDWLINIGNDGWFGRTVGPYQHLATAQARTIEQGLPMARANGTGVSAVIDSYGRILARTDLGVAGNIDIHLPTPLPATLYSRWSDTLFFLFLMLLSIYAYCPWNKRSPPGRTTRDK